MHFTFVNWCGKIAQTKHSCQFYQMDKEQMHFIKSITRNDLFLIIDEPYYSKSGTYLKILLNTETGIIAIPKNVNIVDYICILEKTTE